MGAKEESEQTKKRLWITVIVISAFSLFIIILLYKNLRDEDKLRLTEAAEMREEIDNLTKIKKALSKTCDSLQKNVDYFWPMRSVVYNAKLRDKVLVDLELKPGDACRHKADSSIVVITDVIVGGNQYTYFVNFRARNKNGELIDYSPFELEPISNKSGE